MSQVIEVAPSILSADFARLGEEVAAVTRAKADLIHIDVMDGHFVPNITMGPQIVRAIRPYSTLPFDVHLMISPADPYIEAFAQAGADIITVHPEAGPHIHRTLQMIRSLGKKVGIALNPGTPADQLVDLLKEVDQVLIMTVNPGFGGQYFNHRLIEKIKRVRAMIDEVKHPVVLEVDGGINPATAKQVIEAGATRLVAGTAIFSKGAKNYQNNIKALKNLGAKNSSHEAP